MSEVKKEEEIPPKQTSPEGETPENLPPKKEGEEGEHHEEGEHEIPPKTEEIPPKKEETPKPEVTPPVDYRGKFSESTRRNQIVESQLAELQKTLTDITKQEIPTDEEMRLIDRDWEYRSDFEKNQAIKTVVLEKRLNLVTSTLGNISQEQGKASQLQSFIENEPKLKGKEDEFYKFATSKKNQGADVGVLLNAFLFEVTPPPDPKDPTPPPTVPETPPTLNRSTPSGGNPPVKDTKLSDEEIKIIRTTDHKRYNELVRTGQI